MTDRRPWLEDWLLGAWRDDAAVLPAFPMVATRLVDALEQPEVEIDLVEEIISQDASITALLIRAANSAFYASASPIEDLRNAVMRLGFREATNVAMAAACESLFAVENRAELEVFPEVWDRLWQSALSGAYAARLIASELKLGDPGRAFQGAMFRDIGCLLILKLVAAGLVHGRLRRRPSEAELRAAFEALHVALGAEYLRRFEMPQHVLEIVEQHHAASVAFSHDTVVLHAVRLADALCQQLAIAPFATHQLGPAGEESAALLGIDEERLEYFALQLEGIGEQLRELF